MRFAPEDDTARNIGGTMIELTINGVLVNLEPGATTTSFLIDIEPGSFPNRINLSSGGPVRVAILSTTTFDAATVNPASVTLAGAPVELEEDGTPVARLEDVNGDGLLDLVVRVRTRALQLTVTDAEAHLEGQTFGGAHIRGVDSVSVSPPYVERPGRLSA